MSPSSPLYNAFSLNVSSFSLIFYLSTLLRNVSFLVLWLLVTAIIPEHSAYNLALCT